VVVVVAHTWWLCVQVLVRLQTLMIERDSSASSLFAKDSQFFEILVRPLSLSLSRCVPLLTL
jgi:hypothetical protein